MHSHRLLLNLNLLRRAWPLLWLLARLRVLGRSRQALARLGPDRLADIGLSAEAQRREAARPLWDAPEHWFDRRGPF